MKPQIVYGYRYGLMGGVCAQLLNRYPHFSAAADIAVLFENDHGMVARFPRGTAFETPTVGEQALALRMLDPDVTVVIDSPTFLDAWEMAGKPGKLVVEVHTTTSNLGYLDDLERLRDDIAALVTVSGYMRELLGAQKQLTRSQCM